MEFDKGDPTSTARLNEILAEYIEASEKTPQRLSDWINRYSKFAPDLERFINNYTAFDASPDFGDDYDQAAQVGAGGMGTVYRAHQKSLDRFVALKTIHAGLLASREERSQLLREARAAARLKHPNIVTVHGVHDAGNLYFVSMEYVGNTLDQLISTEPLAAVPAARLLQRVAVAVQFAHDSKILHRDLKPSNILIEPSGQPKVTDFGLAKVIEADALNVYASGIAGTAAYMPPEQAQGERIDARSDVYALGATLYHAITVYAPFRGQNVREVLDQVLHAPPESPKLLRPDTPDDLERICMRCLQKDPNKRYVSARALADDLQAFLDGGSILTPPSAHRLPSLSTVGLIAGPAAAAVIGFATQLPVPAVAAWMMIWWITEAAPAAATAFLPLVMFPLTGVLRADDVAKSYVEDDLFLFLGGTLIALGLEDSGLSRRFALKTMSLFGNEPRTLVLALMYATAFLSMWLSNTASTLAMLPIAAGLALQMESDSDPRETQNLRKALILGVAYAATTGGLGTPVGTPANQQLLGFAQISFLRWLAFGFPCVVVLTTTAWLLLVRRAFPVRARSSLGAQKRISEDLNKMGRLSTRERRMLVIAIATAVLWIARPAVPPWIVVHIGMVKDGTIAMIMALVCFIVPAYDRRGERLLSASVMSRVPWSVWVLFGGGLALASGIRETRLDRAVGLRLTEALAGLPQFKPIQAAAAAGIGALLTQLTSNLSSATILLPVLQEGIRRLPSATQMLLLTAATLGVSCDFMFPFSTPPNAIVFAAGKLTIRDMLRAGFWLTLAGVIAIAVSVACFS